ncbi:DUF6029 family protein [Myroides indicus]|uniref:Uncharacterized protein n=1 Tax=Myroides indicus TaxID=1323422 RepID=A0A4R7EM35_9FLAO|nr:DUF6029 family protein [Myroides indicus]TDS51083.1 hypothetical protein C8P70_14411 [Myroides indicus]
MKKIVVLGCLLCGYVGFSQVRVGFENNSQWYVDDQKVKIDEKEADERFRSNSYLKVDYDYKKWTFGVQVEGYEPKALLNYSPDLKKVDLGTIYVRYNDIENGLDVTAGHFYDQFGSGLLFRSWEDRQLGINNSIFGVDAKYNLGSWGKITALGGRQRIGMGFDLSKSLILGGDLEISLSDMIDTGEVDLTVGGSYLGRVLSDNDANKELDRFTNGYSFRADLLSGNYYLNVEYVLKNKDYLFEGNTILDEFKQKGGALLVNSGYSERGFAVNLNLRRMENMGFYSEREKYGNDYNAATLNYIPALTKQYDYSLQNIYVYQAQSSFDIYTGGKLGEIGGQFDLFYELPKGSVLGGKYGANIVLNGSYWAGLKNKMNSSETGVEAGFFDFGDKYYHDLGLEVRKKWSKKWSSIFMFLNQYYNVGKLEFKPGVVNVNIFSAESTYQFMDNKSVRLELQHLWADADKKNWMAGTVEFALNNNWSVFASDMYNYGNDDKEKRIHYYNAGVSFTKGTMRVSTSYGRQRGGLLCVGGVCRMVSEAAGLTIGITSSF